MKEKHLVIFESREIRRTWHNERWYFAVEDVVQALIESGDTKQYIQRMKLRDPELAKGYVQFVHTLDIPTKGGVQKMLCSDLEGIFRIIQSIPSPKAEPFKLWLAKIGKERIDEIQDPELAVNRAKAIYERKGYPRDWVDKRMRGIAVRNTLTDEWKNRGVQKSKEFAILTDEIYKGTFDLTAKEYKNHKSSDREDNLRDHMEDLELILTMLGEATTTKLTKERDSNGLPKLQTDAKEGGEVAGKTRVDIEKRVGKKVVSKENFLPRNRRQLQ
jgi:prophage antirepressor-like protein